MGIGMDTPIETNRRLTSEQIQLLLQKLSSDEQKELGQMLKTCTTEMTFTRGMPFAAAVVGSLYLARQRLPASLHFGPKKWPFYLVIGIGALTTANLLSMSTCTERIQPRLSALWQKYSNENASGVTYDDLRKRNREGIPLSNAARTSIVHPESTTGVSLDVPKRNDSMPPISLENQRQQSVSSVCSSDIESKSDQLRSPAFVYDEPSYMSGTPVGTPRKTQYGDEGFS